jgi:hypothetical protein
MNGTMCPHASGEGPDSLAAAGPDEPAPSERAPSGAPLAPAVKPAVTAPASKPAAPKPVAQVPKPITQVTKPATQVQSERPATTTPTAQSAPAAATTAAARAVSTTTVAEPPRAERARAKRPAPRADTARRSFAHRFNGLEPRAAGPYAVRVETVARPVAGSSAPGRPSPFPVGLLVALVAAAATIGGLLLRRRGHGGSALSERADAPIEPASAGAAIEAELHEIISEARARQLLAPAPVDEHAERHESVGTR